MAAFAQIRDMVQAAVDAVTGRYDERMDRLEERVTALESGTAARRTPRKGAPAATAHAGTAEAKGKATGP